MSIIHKNDIQLCFPIAISHLNAVESILKDMETDILDLQLVLHFVHWHVYVKDNIFIV